MDSTPARVFAPGWLHVEGTHIADVEPDVPPRPPDLELPWATVVPGFVDAHTHGGGGASFDTGTQDAAATVAKTHRACGTTSIVASLVGDHPYALAQRVRELSPLVDDGLLAGFHLEGPWLSPRRARVPTTPRS